ncbi:MULTISPECIES: ribbon-helix-helix domain-containing protein [unclassified Nitratireductor]|uniref:ribbon-helix-helix domain-containing protein n=1 Tax=unclassified Nitratireductor TaxID=2641084 RepID=UPI002600D311|nr:ribbon-helix-helix domain-containing protein [Nitratireductor sp.]
MSRIAKRSVSIRGHRTSVSLEEPFLAELESIAHRRNISLAALIAEIDAGREDENNLSSQLRLYVLQDLKTRTLPRS